MKKIKAWVKDLPERKKYIDVITAIMTVPILLTVMVTNILNLSNNGKANAAMNEEDKPKPTVSEVIKILPVQIKENDTSTSKTTTKIVESPTPSDFKTASSTPTTTTGSCKKEVGPVNIVSPAENESVSSNPVCIDILYKSGDYCGVTWQYRLNGGSWSDYLDNSICIDNLSSGNYKLELKVRSVTSSDETLVVRNFTYSSNQNPATATPVPTITPEPSDSAESASSAAMIIN